MPANTQQTPEVPKENLIVPPQEDMKDVKPEAPVPAQDIVPEAEKQVPELRSKLDVKEDAQKKLSELLQQIDIGKQDGGKAA